MENYGKNIYDLVKNLFSINRSLTGEGVRNTIKILSDIYPIQIYEVPSGSKVFDWVIPPEWNIKEAYIDDEYGNRIIDFKNNNLHVLGYSIAVDKTVSKDELLNYIYTDPEQPEAIPYVTSYYKECFGFCMSENQKHTLKDCNYHIFIDAEHNQNGFLTYGEIKIPGESKKEIFISTYICHPSMANNELSGPCVTIYLAKWISQLKNRRYSYRIIFIPETIGSITYLSKNFVEMKKNIIAGFNISCVGDDNVYSYIPSRTGNTLADKVAKNILKYHTNECVMYSFLDRGSDERQYCSVNIDLPICCICRSKYGEYPEYHTSLDNMDYISENGLQGGFEIHAKCIKALENNNYYKTTTFCEPQLGKRGLYPTTSKKGNINYVRMMMDILAFADGNLDIFELSELINVSIDDMMPILKILQENNLITKTTNKEDIL